MARLFILSVSQWVSKDVKLCMLDLSTWSSICMELQFEPALPVRNATKRRYKTAVSPSVGIAMSKQCCKIMYAQRMQSLHYPSEKVPKQDSMPQSVLTLVSQWVSNAVQFCMHSVRAWLPIDRSVVAIWPCVTSRKCDQSKIQCRRWCFSWCANEWAPGCKFMYAGRRH